MRRMILISNNPDYAGISHPGLETILIPDRSSLDVLREARDKIHLGWKLSHHPLYGNIRPKQQPFRTILLEEPSGVTSSLWPADLYSLELITKAVSLYEYESEKDELSCPWSVPPSMKADCAFLDRELMRETLAQAGLPSHIHSMGRVS